MSTETDLRRAAARVERAEQSVHAAREGLSAAVRGALADGESAVQVAAVLGVTRARVYQLRDGTR